MLFFLLLSYYISLIFFFLHHLIPLLFFCFTPLLLISVYTFTILLFLRPRVAFSLSTPTTAGIRFGRALPDLKWDSAQQAPGSFPLAERPFENLFYYLAVEAAGWAPHHTTPLASVFTKAYISTPVSGFLSVIYMNARRYLIFLS